MEGKRVVPIKGIFDRRVLKTGVAEAEKNGWVKIRRLNGNAIWRKKAED